LKPLLFVRLKYTPFGGAENYLSRLCSSLESKNIDYRVASTNWRAKNALTIFAPKFLPSFVRAALFAFGVCRQKKMGELLFSLERIPCADVYRAGDGVHLAWINARVENGEKRLKILLNPLHFTYLWLEKRTFQNAKKIIANSKFVKNDIIKYYGIDAAKIEVVYNGAPKNDICVLDAKKRLEAELGAFGDAKTILFVGSGFARKGVSEFLALLSKLQPHSYRAFVVGKERNMQKYRDEAAFLGVDAVFTGARADAELFFAAADIFLFPTRYEPFSNVCLEALAAGCAVITTAQNGASEILDDKFVMKSSNDIDILTELNALLCDEDYLQSVKAQSRAIAEKFSVERNTQETLSILEKL